MMRQVEKGLGEVRPLLQADGGGVELVGVEGGVVRVRLTGGCRGCPMSGITLENGIEAHVRKLVPGVMSVEAVQ
jgi:Fe-S cluster biogenesis protein NfuA